MMYEPPHDKTDKMVCAPSEDSDQPGYPPSLIRVFAVRMTKAWVLNYPSSAQRRLWSEWADAQADLRFRWAKVILLVLSWGGSYIRKLTTRSKESFMAPTERNTKAKFSVWAHRKLNLQTRMRNHPMGATRLIIGQTLRLLPLFMCANSEGSGESRLSLRCSPMR